MKRLFWLLLLGLFGVGANLLGLLWPPDQVVASLFGRSSFGVLFADAKAWIWSSFGGCLGLVWGVHYSVQNWLKDFWERDFWDTTLFTIPFE